jgi:hypothetical protein
MPPQSLYWFIGNQIQGKLLGFKEVATVGLPIADDWIILPRPPETQRQKLDYP